MKEKKNIFGIGLLMAFCLLVSSCTKEGSNGETIVPIGEEYFDIEELFMEPEVKASFDEVREKMGICHEGSILPYYKDLIPPKLEGSYLMNHTMLIESYMGNEHSQVAMPNVTMNFTHQHNSIATIEFMESSMTQKTDTVYIIGNSDGFTAYFIEKKEYDQPYNGQTYHVKIKRGIIMSGSVTPNGLSGVTAPEGHTKFRYASIIMKWENDPPVGLPQYDPGTYFIYEEDDGLAEKL